MVEWDKQADASTKHGFSAHIFASSNCWGSRPFLVRKAFDPELLLSREDGDNHEDDEDREEIIHAWPSWKDVVEIAADDDSESR